VIDGEFESADEILEGVDCPLFRDQRLSLINVIDYAKKHRSGSGIDAIEVDHLEGLQQLLDEIADYMADVMGKKDVLITTDEEEEYDLVVGTNEEGNTHPDKVKRMKHG
jgi:hypothetical protein